MYQKLSFTKEAVSKIINSEISAYRGFDYYPVIICTKAQNRTDEYKYRSSNVYIQGNVNKMITHERIMYNNEV